MRIVLVSTEEAVYISVISNEGGKTGPPQAGPKRHGRYSVFVSLQAVSTRFFKAKGKFDGLQHYCHGYGEPESRHTVTCQD